MEKFVELIQRVHKERFSVVMNKIVAEKIPVAFLSLETTNNAINAANNFCKQGVNVIALITLDTTPPTDLNTDFEILHIDKFLKLPLRPKYIFVDDATAARFAVQYISDCTLLYPIYRNTEAIYNTFMEHLTDLQEVYESLIDEESKKTFCGYWLSSITERFGEIVYTNTQHYILNGFIPERNSILIDVGAYDGGTATFFSEMGYKVYAFEMDTKNFERAKKISEGKNFVIENMGLGSYEHEMRYKSNGSISQFDPNGSEVAKVTTLDAYVRRNKIPRVDFIKFDVEGAELDVLKGATTVIAQFKPILAISAYHKWDDFWTLMKFVKSIRPDYEFAMRQYRSSLEDLPPSDFNLYIENMLYSLGLDVKECWYNECVLFAR